MKRLKNLIRFDFLLTNQFKAWCTLFMSLVAIALFVINPTGEREICMYAILVSTMADLVLMDYRNIPSYLFKRKHFYAGMALFAITHVLYAICFFGISQIENMAITDIRTSTFLYRVIMSFSMAFAVGIAYKKSIIFRIASLVYIIAISLAWYGMYSCAELFGGRYILAAVGITMFWISDMFILIRETLRDTNLIRKLIWVFYPIGQLLILSSV